MIQRPTTSNLARLQVSHAWLQCWSALGKCLDALSKCVKMLTKDVSQLELLILEPKPYDITAYMVHMGNSTVNFQQAPEKLLQTVEARFSIVGLIKALLLTVGRMRWVPLYPLVCQLDLVHGPVPKVLTFLQGLLDNGKSLSTSKMVSRCNLEPLLSQQANRF